MSDESGLHPQSGRHETEKERIDRNLQEMLGELRVALPGVQVLFAFLLVVPFNQRFGQVTDFQKTLYLITLLFTTAWSSAARTRRTSCGPATASWSPGSPCSRSR